MTREISDFAQRVRQRAAVGLVVALGFEDEAIDVIDNMGLLSLSHDDMIYHVRLWDAHKQGMAVNYTTYAFLRLEMSAPLTKRFQEFVAEVAGRFGQKPLLSGGAVT